MKSHIHVIMDSWPSVKENVPSKKRYRSGGLLKLTNSSVTPISMEAPKQNFLKKYRINKFFWFDRRNPKIV